MREIPILFSASMVRAIIDGKKTQTRRVVKPQLSGCPYNDNGIWVERWFHTGDDDREIRCPYGQRGDKLWVRENWQYYDWNEDGMPCIRYAADNATVWPEVPEEWAERIDDIWATLSSEDDNMARDRRWRPSIHMPRWASRITIEITAVRVERLQDISEADALDEGITYNDIANNGLDPMRARRWYRGLWESINGTGSWDENPWVWVIDFRRMDV